MASKYTVCFFPKEHRTKFGHVRGTRDSELCWARWQREGGKFVSTNEQPFLHFTHPSAADGYHTGMLIEYVPSERFTLKKKRHYTWGIDLDNVCADYVGYMSLLQSKKTGLAPASPHEYSLVESGMFSSREEQLEMHTEAVSKGLWASLPLAAGVVEVTRGLHEKGDTVHIITARFMNNGQHKKVLMDTMEWLDNAGIPVHAFSVTDKKKNVYADIFIDDNPRHIRELHASGRNVVAFSSPYNIDMYGYNTPQRMLRANSWADIKRFVEDINLNVRINDDEGAAIPLQETIFVPAFRH